MTETTTTRVYVEEDERTPMTCGDCGTPTYYDYEDEAYHHAIHPQNGCGLILAEFRAPDPAHPLARRIRQAAAARARKKK